MIDRNHALPITRQATLVGILSVLRPEQLAAFCGSAVAWHFRARDSLWQSFATAELAASAALHADIPAALDGDQCASLIAASESDEMIAGLLYLRPDYAKQHMPSRLHALATRARALADAMQLEGPAQRLSLCELLMQRPELAATPNGDTATLRALLA